jgi:hypothetical protein
LNFGVPAYALAINFRPIFDVLARRKADYQIPLPDFNVLCKKSKKINTLLLMYALLLVLHQHC